MSTKNYDSSQLTRKNQAKVLGGYATAVAAQVNSPTGQYTVRSTQPTYQSAVIVTYQNLGKGYCCGIDSPYTQTGLTGTCGCGTASGAS
jgi:hypothetical protein